MLLKASLKRFFTKSAPSPQTFSLIFEVVCSLSRDFPPSKCFLKNAMVINAYCSAMKETMACSAFSTMLENASL